MLMLTLLTLALGAVPQPAPLDPLAARQQLLAVEQRIDVARLNCNSQYLAKIEAGHFLFTDTRGATRNKSQDVAAETRCRESGAAISIDDPRVELYGDAAVVTDQETIRSPHGVLPQARTMRVTDVFAWHDSRWYLVARHESRVSPENNR